MMVGIIDRMTGMWTAECGAYVRARGVIACVLAASLLAAGPAAAQEPASRPPGLGLPVVEDTLENGMRVLALHRPGAPTASFVLRYDVGSVDELPGQTGLVHFMEHLLFKGTTTIGTRDLREERMLFDAMDAAQDSLLMGQPGSLQEEVEARLRERIATLEGVARTFMIPNHFDEILTQSGARDMNATTGYESTTYYVRLPANRAELWFVLEADRMANPVFREFYAERDVVAEERRTRVDANPAGRLVEEFYGAAYRVHPYGDPVIGHMEDIRTHTRREVQEYHSRYYRPNNAVVAIVGDIDPAQMLEWARQYFGPIAPGVEAAATQRVEPAQEGERRIEVELEASPQLIIGWHVPEGYHEDAPALSVLTRVLAGGSTGRLYRRLVIDDPLATSVAVSLGPGFTGPRLLSVTAQPLTGVDIDTLEAAIYDELDRLLREPPTADELARVRNQMEAAEVRRLADNLGLASQLAQSVGYHGDWRETFRVTARLTSVTSEDIQGVVEEYLTRANRTVAVLKPSVDGGEEGAPDGDAGDDGGTGGRPGVADPGGEGGPP